MFTTLFGPFDHFIFRTCCLGVVSLDDIRDVARRIVAGAWEAGAVSVCVVGPEAGPATRTGWDVRPLHTVL